MTLTTGSLTCTHDLFMHACTHVFCLPKFFFYSIRLNGCLFHWVAVVGVDSAVVGVEVMW